jgi:hypothetical protein
MMRTSDEATGIERQLKLEIEELLRRSKSSEELVDSLHTICDPHGRVEGITVSCGGFFPHRLVCMIRVSSEREAADLSSLLGVIAGGTADVIFSYELPTDFSCLNELAKSSSACLCFPVVMDLSRSH